MTRYLPKDISKKDYVEQSHHLFNTAVNVSRELGFQYCAYGISAVIPMPKQKEAIFSNYPLLWQNVYHERGYIEIDPTIRHALSNSAPMAWTGETFDKTPDLWAEMQKAGLHSGWIQSHRVGVGAIALFTLAREDKQSLRALSKSKRAKLVWLSQLVHNGMSKYLVPQLFSESSFEMTRREKEILRWTGQGKTASEIGQILSIAERTVNFHVANAVRKLAVMNKTHAAVKATALGLIF